MAPPSSNTSNKTGPKPKPAVAGKSISEYVGEAADLLRRITESPSLAELMAKMLVAREKSAVASRIYGKADTAHSEALVAHLEARNNNAVDAAVDALVVKSRAASDKLDVARKADAKAGHVYGRLCNKISKQIGEMLVME